MAWLPHCCSALTSSPRPEAGLSLWHVVLLVFTCNEGTLSMLHIRRPQIFQDSSQLALFFISRSPSPIWDGACYCQGFALQKEPLVWQLSVQCWANFKALHYLLTYLSATHLNILPSSVNSCLNQLSFHTWHVILSCWLLSNTYCPCPAYLAV